MTTRPLPFLLGLALLVAPGCDSSGIGAELAALELLFGCDITEITVGDRATGRLTTSDCGDETFLDGRFADDEDDYYLDLFAFEVEDNTELEIALSSTTFDPIVGLFSEAGTLIDTDDDGGVGTNSLLIADVTPGIYVVLVTSFGPGETGAYTLDVERGVGVAIRRPAPRPKGGGGWVGR